MTDFLTNLAARGAGVAETLQPRVPALFEPLWLGSRLPAPPEFAELERESPDEPHPPADTRPPVTQEPVTGIRHFRQMAAEEPRTQAAPPGDTNRSPAPPAASQSPAPAMLAPEPKAAAIRPVELHPVHSVSTGSFVHQPAEAASAGRAFESMAPLKPREPEAAPTKTPAGKEPPVQPAVSRNEPPPPMTAQPLRSSTTIVEPRVTARVEMQKHAAAPSSAKSPEPVIQVTIGRIEVRATPEPPAARKAHAATPVTSLDEYLRNRVKRGNA